MRFRFLSPPFHLLFPLSDGNSSRRRYQTGIEKGIHQFIYRHLSLLDALQCSPCVCVDNNNNNIYITFSFFLYRSADAQTICTQLRAQLISFGDLVATL